MHIVKPIEDNLCFAILGCMNKICLDLILISQFSGKTALTKLKKLTLQRSKILLFQQISSGGWTSSIQDFFFNHSANLAHQPLVPLVLSTSFIIKEMLSTESIAHATCRIWRAHFSLHFRSRKSTPPLRYYTHLKHMTQQMQCKSRRWCCHNNSSSFHVHNGQLICIAEICEIDKFLYFWCICNI